MKADGTVVGDGGNGECDLSGKLALPAGGDGTFDCPQLACGGTWTAG